MREFREHEVITLTNKRDMAYLVSDGAQVTLKSAEISKVSQPASGINDVNSPAIGAIAVINGGKMTYLHGSISTTDTPGQYAYVGGEESELHFLYTSLASAAMVSYGVVASHEGTVHARGVDVASAGNFDCAFSAAHGGNIYLNELDTSGPGALACSFEGESFIYLDHVIHSSNSWPVLFLKGSPTVVISNSDLTNTVAEHPVIYNYVESDKESPSSSRLEIANSKLTASTNGAIFEFRNMASTEVWLTHTEVRAEASDLL